MKTSSKSVELRRTLASKFIPPVVSPPIESKTSRRAGPFGEIIDNMRQEDPDIARIQENRNRRHLDGSSTEILQLETRIGKGFTVSEDQLDLPRSGLEQSRHQQTLGFHRLPIANCQPTLVKDAFAGRPRMGW